MSDIRIIDLGKNNIELHEDEIPLALIYFGRLAVRDWEDLFFVAVKCLYTEYPDIINRLCSKDSNRVLFLRTTTIDMKHPRRIAPIIFLETARTPKQIIQAILTIFHYAGVVNINMKIEVAPMTAADIPELEELFPPEILHKDTKKIYQSAEQKVQLPNFSLDQSIDEMIAALDSMDSENFTRKQNFYNQQATQQNYSRNEDLQVPIFGSLFFLLFGKRYGPFANEKTRYVELMRCLAEFFPDEMLKQAGRHINSAHRLTLMHGKSYLYFREPVMLPNDLFTDKGFPDNILIENEKYYLDRCGLSFDSVMRA